MAKNTKIDTAERATNRRSSTRRALQLEALGGSTDNTASNVLIHNLSATGLLLESDVPLAAGDSLQIDMPHAGLTSAEVIWTSGNLYGCRFDQAISTAAISAAQLLSPVEVRVAKPGTLSGDAQEAFGARLRRLRKDRGLSVPQVAQAVGLSDGAIWMWEAGKSHPRPERIEALSAALGVPARELITGAATAGSERSDAPIAASNGARVWSGNRGDPVGTGERLSQLIAASKAQIAVMAGTTADKVKIILEL
jgi:transcriptional regulator with XRE-family HTH domain